MTNNLKCFVIMPFSETTTTHTEEYWDKHFKNFLHPIIEDIKDIQAFRSMAVRGDILKQIITDLVTASVVIADLTDLNPNVLWELGVRQSFKHGTITIAESGTKLPFDIDKKGTLFYCPSNHTMMEDFRKKLKYAILDCINNPERPDSQVLDTISGRGSLFEILEREETIRKIEAFLDEIKSNEQVLGLFTDSAIKKKNKDEKYFTGQLLFRTSAIELLVTTRYIDKKLIDYDFIEECFNMFIFVNANLMRMSIEALATWISQEGNQNVLKRDLKKMTDSLLEIKKQLKSYP